MTVGAHGVGGVEAEIQALVDRETAAWDRQHADALVALLEYPAPGAAR